MFAYQRLDQLMRHVHTNTYITAAKLAELLKVSERTIRSDVAHVNSELSSYGASIRLKRNAGYYLEITDHSAFKKLEKTFNNKDSYEMETAEDRIRYLLKSLLYATDYIATDDFIDQLYISKNTLSNYIRSIKKIIENYDLDYVVRPGKGARIIGNEIDKRRCIINEILSQNLDNYVTGFTKEEYMLFAQIDLDKLKDIIMQHLITNHIKTDDYSLKNLIIHFALSLSRVMNDDYISINGVHIPEEIMKIIEAICDDIEQTFNVTMTKGEKIYTGIHMLGDIKYQNHNVNDELLKKRIDRLLELIYLNYSFDLRNDNILKNDLFNHIKYTTSISGYPIENHNPLLNTIKTNYPLPYDIAETTIKQCFNIRPYIMTDDNIGYIALHIGAAIERCFSGSITRKSVYLVCGSGQATTRMLEARLNNVFGNKIKILGRYSYHEFQSLSISDFTNADFVISTIPLKSDYISVINVDFSLKQEDIENISHFLNAMDSDKMNRVKKFFSPDLFFRKKHVTSKEAILEEMIDQMKQMKIVDDNFLKSVMEREKLGQTNLNDVFALPHPMGAIGYQTKVAVAILNDPIQWNDSAIRIIFLLSIRRQDQENIEHLYDIFIEIVNNKKFQQQLLTCNNYEDFVQIISKHMTQ